MRTNQPEYGIWNRFQIGDKVWRCADHSAARHAIILRLGRVLDDREPAHLFDLTQPKRSIGTCARQDHSYGVGSMSARQALKKMIDRLAFATPLLQRAEP